MNEYSPLSGLNPDDYTSAKVAVAMSGGVDSSLTAMLLKEAGFDVVGITMNLWDYETYGGTKNPRGCCDLSAFQDARAIAATAGIPHFTVNLKEEFGQEVVNDFVSEYISGRTPNPCVLCNTTVKWRILLTKARAMGYDLFATGHYARIVRHGDSTYSLMTGRDTEKDQSYFLWGLDSDNLANTLFPLGTMTKDETRSESLKRTLKTAGKSESQEICFIPDDDYGRFLRNYIQGDLPVALSEGDILDSAGAVIGKHKGSAYYTIGQRKGLGIALGHPVYVTSVDTKANTVSIGEKDELLSGSMTVKGVNWIRGFPPGNNFHCTVKIRYRHKRTSSEVVLTDDGIEVTFDTPQLAVTPGQSAVFYDGDIVLGGGVIEKAE